MGSFSYNKIPMSIQETPFAYITNLNDYKTMSHILEVICSEKITNELLVGIFNNIKRAFNETINILGKNLADSVNISQNKLESLTKSGNRLLILTNNEQYMSFASYPKGFEEDDDNIVFTAPPSVLYNVGMLENTGSVSVVPSNANVFLSSMLYAFSLMYSDLLYSKLNQDILLQVSKIYYNVLMSAFGRKSGLIVGSREDKDKLFFLTCCFTYSIYVPKNKAMMNLKDFLAYCSSNVGSSYLPEFMHRLINSKLTGDSSNPWNTSNYDSLLKLSNIAREMELLECSESEIKIQWFKMLGNYGIMALENYPRLVAYISGTLLPNAYISSSLRVYNKIAYEYLLEFFMKTLYGIRV